MRCSAHSLGVMLAHIAVHVTLPFVPQFLLPRLGGIVIDAHVVAFCLGLSRLSTLLIGLVPALRVAQAAHDGRPSGRAAADAAGRRMALTFVLLIGAGLLVHSFVRLTSVSPGFELSGRNGVVQTVKVTLPERLYDRPAHPCVRRRRARSHPVPAGREVREPDQLAAVRHDVHPRRL